jgi:peptide/nickel transport system substrate-binding protein
MKKFGIIFTVAIIAGIIWFSYGSSGVSTGVEKGGTIIIGISGDVDTFNPLYAETASAQEISHLFLLGLADLDENSEFSPELAKEWKQSEDYLKLTYYLREDAVWSDGIPITAEDVKFTYDLLMDTIVASPRQGFTEFIKDVIVEDAHTVTFEFTEAYPAQIFDTAGEVLPKHILENVDRASLRTHEFGRNPVSSGPFKLSKWVAQQYIEVTPNEKYFKGKANLDKIIFKIVPDNTNLLLQLQSGEIDMMAGIPPAEIDNLKNENDDINVYQVSGRLYYYIGYSQKNTLFQNVNVRRALTMAIDRDKMIQALLYGYGSKCLGPLPPIVKWAYNEDVEEIPHDLQQAKQVLANEGWTDSDKDGFLDKNGRTFEFSLMVSTGNQVKTDVAVIVQNQLTQLGIKVNIQTLEWTNFLDHLQALDFDACVGGLSSSYYIDPTPVFHSSATNMFNAVSYANPEVDRLIESGRQEMDQKKAAETWKKFQELVYYDQPYTFLFWLDKAVGVNKKFKNVTPLSLSSIYNIENWYQE